MDASQRLRLDTPLFSLVDFGANPPTEKYATACHGFSVTCTVSLLRSSSSSSSEQEEDFTLRLTYHETTRNRPRAPWCVPHTKPHPTTPLAAAACHFNAPAPLGVTHQTSAARVSGRERRTPPPRAPFGRGDPRTSRAISGRIFFSSRRPRVGKRWRVYFRYSFERHFLHKPQKI